MFKVFKLIGHLHVFFHGSRSFFFLLAVVIDRIPHPRFLVKWLDIEGNARIRVRIRVIVKVSVNFNPNPICLLVVNT